MFYKHFGINTNVKRRIHCSWLGHELHQSRAYNLSVPWRVTFLDSLFLSLPLSPSIHSFPSLFLSVSLSPPFFLPLPFLSICLSVSNGFVNHQVGCLILHFTVLFVYFTQIRTFIHSYDKSYSCK